MKILYKSIEKDGQGQIKFIPESSEDIWHVYNLILPGDRVKSSTYRKVQKETAISSGESEKIRIDVAIEVVGIEFDGESSKIRLHGKICEENRWVKMGSFQPIIIEETRSFTLFKTQWDTISLERVEQACDPNKEAEIAAIIMQEGLANLCLITGTMTLVRAKIEKNIPRKRKGGIDGHQSGLNRFFENVFSAMKLHFQFQNLKIILVASPGYVNEQFYNFCEQYSRQNDTRWWNEQQSKFILVHSSSGYKSALKEVLSDPRVESKIKDTRAAKELSLLNDFFVLLRSEDKQDRAIYGIRHVCYALDSSAIQTLFLCDSLFRATDLAVRRKYVDIVEKARSEGTEVKIFSSLHVSGEQLSDLGGIAAILKFPLPDLDELLEEENEDPDVNFEEF